MPIEAWADGGCKNQQLASERAAYGSHKILVNDKVVSHVDRRPYGHDTANQAEYKAVINCLHSLVKRNLLVANINIDCAQVFGQLTGQNVCRAATLKPLYEMAREYLSKGTFTLVKRTDAEVKKVLGH